MRKYLSVGASVAIFLVFIFTLFANVLNAPSFDDYDTTINFIRRFFFDTQSVTMRFDILLSRHNEHRILFSKSSAALYYSIFNIVDFRNLVLFQNLFLLAFFGLILGLLKRQNLLQTEMVLISAIFLFSLAFWQVTYYYWGGIQHYTVFFFSFSTLILLHKADRLLSGRFFSGFLTATLAVLSFGNGFLAFLLGGFMLLIQRKWSLFGVWVVATIVTIALAFLPLTTMAGKSEAAFNPEWMARLLLTFLGSFLYINPASGQVVNIIICMCAGVLVLSFWIWLFFKGYAVKNPLLYCLLSLPVLTGIIVSISRFESKAAGGIAPRYMFFTASIPVLLLLILLDLGFVKKAHLKYISAFCVVLWGLVFVNNKRELDVTNAEIINTLHAWERNQNTPLIYYREPKPYSETMSWAVQKGVVKIPRK